MNLLVIGSKDFKNIDISPYVPKETTDIIACKGQWMCRAAEEYADRLGLPRLIVKLCSGRRGTVMPQTRMEMLVEISDCILAFWDGKSKIVGHSVNYAKKLGKPVKMVEMKLL